METEAPPDKRKLGVLVQWLVLFECDDIKYHWRGWGDSGTREGVRGRRESEDT